MGTSIVVMGVAGCGKSSLAAALAHELGWTLVEGDEYHSAANREKMARGIPLRDEDRQQWLGSLAAILAQRSNVVLSCSALRRRYRDALRTGHPGLRFVFMRVEYEEAARRVAGRGSAHFFSPDLVRSQFETLEPPRDEALVLEVDATQPLAALQQDVLRWLA